MESSFENCDLTLASFEGAWVRNVTFDGSNLADVDLTDADWFNASCLTKKQLISARRNTIRQCPPNVAGMHEILTSDTASISSLSPATCKNNYSMPGRNTSVRGD